MLKSTLTDHQLLEQIRDNDRTAYRLLFDRHYEYLIQSVTNITGDRNLAKDVGQEVFLELWKKRTSINVKTSVRAYLRRSMVNRTFNQLKTRKLKYQEPEKLPETQASENPQEQLEASDLQQLINNAIGGLPERCRIIFTLCRLEGLSHKEIAAQLDISPKTVENQMTKALKILRAVVSPYITKGLLIVMLFSNF